MGFYRGWTTKQEKLQKKMYISLSRRIVKRMVTQEWLKLAPEGYSWDHSMSLEHGYLVHLPIYIINCPANLKLLERGNNLRKGNRSYIGVIQLIDQFNSWSDRDEFKLWINELESKWGYDFESLIIPIKV